MANTASVIVFTLKNIHTNEVMQNTKSMFINFGNRIEVRLLMLFSITNKKPCKAPQIIKFHLAPCQKPLNKNTIKIFLYLINSPFLFPPNGLYKYSLNQLYNEICHLDQNIEKEDDK